MSQWRLWSGGGWTRWRVMAAIAMAALGMATTLDAWVSIAQASMWRWESQYVLFVPVASFWLVWVRRGAVQRSRPTYTVVGLVLVALGGLLYHVGRQHGLEACAQGGAVLVVVGSVGSVVGGQALWRVAPAVLVLGLLVPIPAEVHDRMVMAVEGISCRLSVQAAQCLGAVQAGNELYPPWPVSWVGRSQGADGLALLLPLTLASYTFAFGRPHRFRTRWLILLSTPAAALGWMCLMVLAGAQAASGKPSSWGSVLYGPRGWWLLGGVVVGAWLLIGLWRRRTTSMFACRLAYD